MNSGSRHLDGAWNFRDVADNAPIQPGRLFRSGELSGLGDAGRVELRRLGITDVADLRSAREVARRGPGRVPEGVEVHLLPFPDLAADQGDDDGGESPHENAFRRLLTGRDDAEPITDTAARYMIEEYRRFPSLPGARRAVQQVITLLGAGHTMLAHCFAGKDRTGLTVAVVLETVGVDRDAIIVDYLRSNDAVPQLRAQIMTMISDHAAVTPEVATFSEARLTDEVLGVRADYLDTARTAIDENYGSLDGFLRAAEVSAADVDRLRVALLG